MKYEELFVTKASEVGYNVTFITSNVTDVTELILQLSLAKFKSLADWLSRLANQTTNIQ